MIFKTILTSALWLAICAPASAVPSYGPSLKQVNQSQVTVVDVNDAVLVDLIENARTDPFSAVFGPDAALTGSVANPGDSLEVSIWEAPPATLFTDSPEGLFSGGHANTLPVQMVAVDGTISVPFAGRIQVSGRTPRQIEADILRRLAGKAHQPQIMVRITANTSSTATVVGEVRQALRLPLTPGHERVLDALAAAGGSTAAINKTSLQLTRAGNTAAMPLADVISAPTQNVALQPNDVLTVLTLNQSFTAMGAAGRNEDVAFEASGITLAQAIGRMGGLLDNRANPHGVFVFRIEDRPEGPFPVVYRVDLKDPAMFFAAQRFPVRDKDIVYVANAPAAEFQKFLSLILLPVYPALNIYNAVK